MIVQFEGMQLRTRSTVSMPHEAAPEQEPRSRNVAEEIRLWLVKPEAHHLARVVSHREEVAVILELPQH